MDDRTSINHTWDIIVIGGGITGAGVLREATRAGLRVLLLEQNDFASGTSSRSSKLIHGGLRYLNTMQVGLTWQSIHQRDALLKHGKGLVTPLPFLFPNFPDAALPAWMVEIGLYLYGWLKGKWRIHNSYSPDEMALMLPMLDKRGMTSAFRFYDAQTDDARLVLRVLREALHGTDSRALNYARVLQLLRDDAGQVTGVAFHDKVSDCQHTAHAKVIINATGAWADHLRGGERRIRPLRGSHMIFRQDRFPVYQAISFTHPVDGRPVFAIPWQGVTLLGTTDVDHTEGLADEPRITPAEIDYLMEAVGHYFPRLHLSLADVIATFAGVRPVMDDEDVAPSKASREHAIWQEDNLITVTGGKLTTFHLMGVEVVKHLRAHFPHLAIPASTPILDSLPETPPFAAPLPREQQQRLLAHYGPAITHINGPWERIQGLPLYWAELKHAAQHEAVIHLDDLLLRRVRIGLLVACGGEHLLPRLRQEVQGLLGWGDARWQQEVERYLTIWHRYYGGHLR